MLSQVAHFRRHNGKTTTGLPGACGLDGSIQRQNIGLKGDTVDNTDDVDDLTVIT
ncbi:hypothetical protein D3C81_1839180 [compost metagenome]